MVKSGFTMLKRVFFISTACCSCMFWSCNCTRCFFIM
jgi:hypothetical protein